MKNRLNNNGNPFFVKGKRYNEKSRKGKYK